jgi:hypothetical protein
MLCVAEASRSEGILPEPWESLLWRDSAALETVLREYTAACIPVRLVESYPSKVFTIVPPLYNPSQSLPTHMTGGVTIPT